MAATNCAPVAADFQGKRESPLRAPVAQVDSGNDPALQAEGLNNPADAQLTGRVSRGLECRKKLAAPPADDSLYWEKYGSLPVAPRGQHGILDDRMFDCPGEAAS